MHLLRLLLPVAALSSAPSRASADDRLDDIDKEQPPPPPVEPQPVYTAPTSQMTGTAYVPLRVPISGPEELTDFDLEHGTPFGYTVVKRTRKGIALVGAITFAASYGMCVVVPALESVMGGEPDSAAMVIPVVGPFLQLFQPDTGLPDTASDRNYLIVFGTAQTLGLIVLFYGLTTKKTVLVRNDLVGSMTVTPMAGDGTAGMLLSGRF